MISRIQLWVGVLRVLTGTCHLDSSTDEERPYSRIRLVLNLIGCNLVWYLIFKILGVSCGGSCLLF